jgi:putative transposase
VVDESRRVLRQAAADRLARLDSAGVLSSDHGRLTAETAGVAERTVSRWVSARRAKAEILLGLSPRKAAVSG